MTEENGAELFDKDELIMLRYLVEQWLAGNKRNYDYFTNPLNREDWMDDAISEFRNTEALYKKLTNLLGDM